MIQREGINMKPNMTGWYSSDSITHPIFEQKSSQMWVGDIAYAQLDQPWLVMEKFGVVLDQVKKSMWLAYTTHTTQSPPEDVEYESSIMVYAVAQDTIIDEVEWENITLSAISDCGMIGIFDLHTVRDIPAEQLITYAEDTSSREIFPFGAYISNFGGNADISVVRDDKDQIVAVRWYID